MISVGTETVFDNEDKTEDEIKGSGPLLMLVD